jgi:hypothetical protein
LMYINNINQMTANIQVILIIINKLSAHIKNCFNIQQKKIEKKSG